MRDALHTTRNGTREVRIGARSAMRAYPLPHTLWPKKGGAGVGPAVVYLEGDYEPERAYSLSLAALT